MKSFPFLRTRHPLLMLLMLPLITSTSHSAWNFQVEVDAGDADRLHSPVQTEIPLPLDAGTVDAFVAEFSSAGDERPTPEVQVNRLYREPHDKPAAELFWIQPRLRAGESATYQLTVRPAPSTGEDPPGFHFSLDDEHHDVMWRDQPVLRVMFGYDADNHEDTQKVYHHVFGFHGEGPITKGPGGRYQHHKGVFMGWNQVRAGDEMLLNSWGSRGLQRHAGYFASRQVEGPVAARFASATNWISQEEETLVRDIREVTVWRPRERMLVIDYDVRGVPQSEDELTLDGDPHHGGIQFRGVAEIADREEEVKYFFPAGAVDLGNDTWAEADWVTGSIPVGERRYAVHFLNNPSNPKPTWGTRTYGRFGPFFGRVISRDDPLRMRYRLVVTEDGAETALREAAARMQRDFAHPPNVTIRPAGTPAGDGG